MAREIKREDVLNAVANFLLSCLPVRDNDFGKPVTPETLAPLLGSAIQAREELDQAKDNQARTGPTKQGGSSWTRSYSLQGLLKAFF